MKKTVSWSTFKPFKPLANTKEKSRLTCGHVGLLPMNEVSEFLTRGQTLLSINVAIETDIVARLPDLSYFAGVPYVFAFRKSNK